MPPGIKTKKARTLMDVPLRDRFTETADAAPELRPHLDLAQVVANVNAALDAVARKPVRQKRRYGLRLLIRRACYFVLSRT